MFIISFKNRLVAIFLTIIISLFATAGLFFAINNLTRSLISFESIKPENTIVSFELFSPLLASIKNNQPVSDFQTINSNLEQIIKMLSQDKLAKQPLKELMGHQGHVIIHFTNNGDVALVTNKKNKFNAEIKNSPALTYNKEFKGLVVYSNNQTVLDTLVNDVTTSKNILISFNDLAKITITNKLFVGQLELTPELQLVKNMLQPLGGEDRSFSARIQQSNHRTKIQFTNLNSNDSQTGNSLEFLLNLLPLNTVNGFVTNFSSSTLDLITNLNNKDIISETVDENMPILYSTDINNNWLIGITSKDSQKIENLASIFSNLYDVEFVSSALPDNTITKEIKISSPKKLTWDNLPSSVPNWQIKTNKNHNLAIASNNDTHLAGKTDYVLSLIKSNGYFPKDCQVTSPSTVLVTESKHKKIYFSENLSKNAIFCLFE